ncbi:hypothetical protein B0H15DRAFT_945865 [Mycena belliarum]|uniref:Uncharacterized protein n=1 Tax=Mycena belliarum TaxID=1033014 RepID=A0AAD6UBT6_9AGAR|nr:hypothetical protein B0H15DRAFT_945865 [Mycena belliae]
MLQAPKHWYSPDNEDQMQLPSTPTSARCNCTGHSHGIPRSARVPRARDISQAVDLLSMAEVAATVAFLAARPTAFPRACDTAIRVYGPLAGNRYACSSTRTDVESATFARAASAPSQHLRAELASLAAAARMTVAHRARAAAQGLRHAGDAPSVARVPSFTTLHASTRCAMHVYVPRPAAQPHRTLVALLAPLLKTLLPKFLPRELALYTLEPCASLSCVPWGNEQHRTLARSQRITRGCYSACCAFTTLAAFRPGKALPIVLDWLGRAGAMHQLRGRNTSMCLVLAAPATAALVAVSLDKRGKPRSAAKRVGTQSSRRRLSLFRRPRRRPRPRLQRRWSTIDSSLFSIVVYGVLAHVRRRRRPSCYPPLRLQSLRAHLHVPSLPSHSRSADDAAVACARQARAQNTDRLSALTTLESGCYRPFARLFTDIFLRSVRARGRDRVRPCFVVTAVASMRARDSTPRGVFGAMIQTYSRVERAALGAVLGLCLSAYGGSIPQLGWAAHRATTSARYRYVLGAPPRSIKRERDSELADATHTDSGALALIALVLVALASLSAASLAVASLSSPYVRPKYVPLAADHASPLHAPSSPFRWTSANEVAPYGFLAPGDLARNWAFRRMRAGGRDGFLVQQLAFLIAQLALIISKSLSRASRTSFFCAVLPAAYASCLFRRRLHPFPAFRTLLEGTHVALHTLVAVPLRQALEAAPPRQMSCRAAQPTTNL